MKKYYVEFEVKDSGEIFSIQSRWFDTKKEALDWFEDSFDLIREEISVFLMSAEFGEDEYGDIELEEVLLD